MPVIQIQHVIFTRVERAYSRKNSTGYQIVYESPGPGRETAQIEKQLQCFKVSGQRSYRYQFFWTEQDQVVLAKSVPLIQPDPDIIDRAQRDAFLAHALVVSKEAFAAVRNDPFAIFEAAERESLFAEDEEQLVSYVREQEPMARLVVPLRNLVDGSGLIADWQPEDLLKLYRFGVLASALSRRQRSLLLLADDQDEIATLLSVILLLIPPDLRSRCTFDTCVDGCSPSAGGFWAVGSSTSKNHPGFLPIRLAEQGLEVKGGDDDFLDPKALAYLA